MAIMEPFRGLRYDLGHVGALSDVVAPPYDVIDAELQDSLYKRHPANVVRLILNRQEPGDASDEEKYQRAARFLRHWRREGILREDPRPAIYPYQQEFEAEGRTLVRSGFMARVRLERLGEGRIFPHEETHSAAKTDRLRLTRACRANLSQIFGLYPDEGCFVAQRLTDAIADQPAIEAVDHLGVRHRIWALEDAHVISDVASFLAPLPVFIADGHHRYETALNYRDELNAAAPLPPDHPANFVLMMFVGMSDPGMVVLPTHRLFRGVPELSSEALRERLAGSFQLQHGGAGSNAAASLWEEIVTANQQGTIGLYTARDGQWTLASVTEAGRARMAELAGEHSPAWRSLGVSILHRLIMESLLGCRDLPKPMYVHSIPEVVHYLTVGDIVGRDATGQLGSGGQFPLAALVMPASVEHVRVISEQGERMPAKSTYFYPKLLSGLVFHPLGST